MHQSLNIIIFSRHLILIMILFLSTFVFAQNKKNKSHNRKNKDTISVVIPIQKDPCAEKGGDTDGDGICNNDDACPDFYNDLTDTDGDGVIDCADPCPNDPTISIGDCRIIEEIHSCGPGDLLFDTGKSTIIKSEYPTINYIANYLNYIPKTTIFYIDGHTDTNGDDAYNKKLSYERALAVKKALVAKGVSEERLIPRGFGETNLQCNENGKTGQELIECRQHNRRVEMWDVSDEKAPKLF